MFYHVCQQTYICMSIYVSALINFQMNIYCLLHRNHTSNIYISKWKYDMEKN